MKADIYSKTLTNCPYCVKAKILLEKAEIAYEEISIEENREACFARVREATGADPRTAPQIFIDGEYIGGHDQLAEIIASGKWNV